MRRGFLNQTTAKPKHPKSDDVPVQPAPLQYPRTDNIVLSDEQIKQWAHKLSISPEELKERMEKSPLGPDNKGDGGFLHRSFVFEDFKNITLADPRVFERLPKHFQKRPPALEGAYKISEAAGKGVAMFATRDIPAGGVILVENPVIVAPFTMQIDLRLKERVFRTLFEMLDTDVRERALALWNCKPADMCGKEEGIIRTNGLQVTMPIPNTPGGPDSTYSGTFLDISRCNHSCGNNASRRWNEKSYSMSLFATRPIRAGEEITIAYIHVDDTRAVRRAKLLDMYYFTCECEYCNISDEALAVSDANRLEIKRMWQNGNPTRPAAWEGKGISFRQLVHIHQKAIDLHEQEGMQSIRQVNHMEALATAYMKLGDQKNSKKWAQRVTERWGVMQYPDAAKQWEEISKLSW